ncbi:YgiQ family radical SAM protein [Clostridium sp. DL1XJH146]
MNKATDFLPISKNDMKNQNIDELDFILIWGDAYVDHPSFSAALIGRVLQSEGFNVGIIPQPNWNDVNEFKKLGKPKYAFLISAGNMDSMVNHYTSTKKRRRKDLYTPGEKIGSRPDRATIVYSNKAREAYKDVPIIIGGIEASLRRFAHYDYWSNKVRRSILMDSKADLLVFGMGEKPIIQIANLMKYGKSINNLTDVKGTVLRTKNLDDVQNFIEVPSFESCSEDKMKYAESYKLEYYEQDPIRGKALVQKHGNDYIVQNIPQTPLTPSEMDNIYNLPYVRESHPIYEKDGGIAALNEVKFSITSHRGCFGGCSFCALNFHQGRIIQKRSEESIVEEAQILTTLDDFKGYIHDIGGPTANFRNKSCDLQNEKGTCSHKQCVSPKPCKNLKVDHTEYLNILRKVRVLPNIKKVFVRSGVRFDYLMYDKDDSFFKELCEHHISGQLKVAPEHINNKVLTLMGKPNHSVYENFKQKYEVINKNKGLKQYLVPYLISSHPGSDLNIAIELALYIKKMNYTPEQVSDFYPTPGSLSTTMFYTGINPLTGEKVYIPDTEEEKKMQRALLQFDLPENHKIVKKALIKANREDLIGYDKHCLIKPYAPKKQSYSKKHKNKKIKNDLTSNNTFNQNNQKSNAKNKKGKSK